MAQSREGGEGAMCSKIWHLQPRPAYIPSHPTYTHHGAACASCIHAHDSCCNTVSSPMIIALPPPYGMTKIKPLRGPPKLTRLTSGSAHRWAQKHQVNPMKNKNKNVCRSPLDGVWCRLFPAAPLSLYRHMPYLVLAFASRRRRSWRSSCQQPTLTTPLSATKLACLYHVML